MCLGAWEGKGKLLKGEECVDSKKFTLKIWAKMSGFPSDQLRRYSGPLGRPQYSGWLGDV